jgi:hypothetical protein
MRFLPMVLVAGCVNVAVAADLEAKFDRAAAAADHITAVEIYGHALEVNIFVENACPKLRTNIALLNALGEWAHLRADRDIPTLIKERQKIVNFFQEKQKEVGTELWCWGIAHYYGPEGNVIKGLISDR